MIGAGADEILARAPGLNYRTPGDVAGAPGLMSHRLVPEGLALPGLPALILLGLPLRSEHAQ